MQVTLIKATVLRWVTTVSDPSSIVQCCSGRAGELPWLSFLKAQRQQPGSTSYWAGLPTEKGICTATERLEQKHQAPSERSVPRAHWDSPSNTSKQRWKAQPHWSNLRAHSQSATKPTLQRSQALIKHSQSHNRAWVLLGNSACSVPSSSAIW